MKVTSMAGAEFEFTSKITFPGELICFSGSKRNIKQKFKIVQNYIQGFSVNISQTFTGSYQQTEKNNKMKKQERYPSQNIATKYQGLVMTMKFIKNNIQNSCSWDVHMWEITL